jgi:hypothetical protein
MENTIYALYRRNVYLSRWEFVKAYKTRGQARNGLSNILYYIRDKDRKETERKRYEIVAYNISFNR